MCRVAVFAVASFGVACLAWQTPEQAIAGGPKHPHMHFALRELREARTELKEAAHDFGGHRAKALVAVDAAIAQMDKALEAVGDNNKGAGKVDKSIYNKYDRHPHINHALVELREARTELKEAAHDFKGHRANALRDVDYAIEQLEVCLKFARK